MSKVVDLGKSDDPKDVVYRAVHLLSRGELVAFPTETVYVACGSALVPAAVERLSSLHGTLADARPALVLKGIQEASDYVPSMSRLARRLARRCWPGPVILAFDVNTEEGLLRALPPQTREVLAAGDQLWIRVPSHECIQEALRRTPAPFVSAPEMGTQRHAPTTAARILEMDGQSLALVIDDGECRYAEPATVVRVGEDAWSILRGGVVTETMIRRLAGEIFLFVCTGNTCRSPLAEGFFRKMLADRLECTEDELADRGFLALSAGISADPGLPASPESVEVARQYGVDLGSHASQPLTQRLLEQADRIFTMTRAHRESILASHPQLAERVELLARDETDIPDPIGAGKAEYEESRVAIERNLRAILQALPLQPTGNIGQ